MEKKFVTLEHPADIGIEAYGRTMQELFLNSAIGLTSIIAGDAYIEKFESRDISIFALDRENLLVRWLTEVLYLFDANKFLASDANFEILNDVSLKAKLFGEIFTPEKHELKLDVKAITYHQIKIEEKGGLWTCRVFFDI